MRLALSAFMLSPLLLSSARAGSPPTAFQIPPNLLSTRPTKGRLGQSLRMSDHPDNESIRLEQANFSPIQAERTIEKFRVEGRIPRELTGLYVRNGANAKHPSRHLFLGEGMLHGIWLHKGQPVRYCNRFVTTDENDLAAGFSNVSVMAYAQRLFSLGEFGPAVEIDPKTLQTVGKFLFAGQRTNNFTAHPKKDVNGELFGFGYELMQQPFLTYMHLNKDAQLIKNEPITLDAAKMIHDFAMTSNHIIFMDLPIVFDATLAAAAMLDHLLGKKASMPFRWQPTQGARLGVMSKAGTQADVQWFDIEPCFIFHTVNAFEQDDQIVLDVVRHATMFAAGTDDYSEPAFLTRYVMDLQTGQVTQTQLDQIATDFPQINPLYVGKPYRYAYCLTTNREGQDASLAPCAEPQSTSLIKYDLKTGQHKKFLFTSRYIPSEFSFVPKQQSRVEDDGYLMGYVFDRHQATSALWIIDTRYLCEYSLAKIHLGVRVPNGFHGTWMADVSAA